MDGRTCCDTLTIFTLVFVNIHSSNDQMSPKSSYGEEASKFRPRSIINREEQKNKFQMLHMPSTNVSPWEELPA